MTLYKNFQNIFVIISVFSYCNQVFKTKCLKSIFYHALKKLLIMFNDYISKNNLLKIVNRFKKKCHDTFFIIKKDKK